MKAFFWFLLLLPLIAGLLTSCGSEKPQAQPDKVTLQLKWLHQAQFAGFYVAEDKGYYSQENLQVEFLEGGQDVDTVQPVLSGKADFGVQSPDDLLVRRSLGQPLVAISAIFRRSPVVFLAMAETGISRPQDFPGKKIASQGTGGSAEFQIQLIALLKKLGLDPARVQTSPYDSSYSAFLSREVDITPAYAISGLLRLRQQGIKLNAIWPSDYGIRFYADTLFTSDKLVTENPGLVERFLRASLRGWQDTMDDYQQAVSITLKYAHGADRQLQTAMMEAMLPLVHTGEDHVGWMGSAVWQDMYAVLNEQSLLQKPFPVDEIYSLKFLEDIYGSRTP